MSTIKSLPALFGTALLYLLLFSCSESEPPAEVDFSSFANVLHIKNIPSGTEDWNSFIFSDEGAWLGFALPPDTATRFYGAFPGPFFHTRGRWLSERLVGFSVEINSVTSVPVNATSIKKEIEYLPGYLKQDFIYESIHLEIFLFYPDKDHAIIEAKIKNTGIKTLQIKGSWSGSLFSDLAEFSQYINLLKVTPYTGTERITLFPYDQVFGWQIKKYSYELKEKQAIELEPGQERKYR